MDAHSFCRELLRSILMDYPRVLKTGDFTVTKSTLSGYEVQGPGRFYHYASCACCKWSAKAEAMEHYIGERTT